MYYSYIIVGFPPQGNKLNYIEDGGAHSGLHLREPETQSLLLDSILGHVSGVPWESVSYSSRGKNQKGNVCFC